MHEDVRDLIGRVTCPTLVTARPGDRMVPFEASAALAEGIPDATFVPLPPGDHGAFDLVDVVTARILDFCEKPATPTDDRVLATVFFTDIVGSTDSSAQRAIATGVADSMCTTRSSTGCCRSTAADG